MEKLKDQDTGVLCNERTRLEEDGKPEDLKDSMNVEEGPETNEPSKSSATEEDDATANEGPGRSTGNPQGMMETGLAVDCDISPGTVAHAALSIACSMMNETRRTNTGSSDSVPNPIPVNRHSRHVTPSPNFPGPEAVVAASIVAATNAVPYAPAMLTAPPPECTSSRDSESMVLRDVSATKAAELYNLMKVDNSPSLPCDTTIFVNNDVEGNSTVSSLMATRVSVPSYVVETGVATVGPLAHSVPAAMTLDDTKPLVNNDCIELPSEEEMISSLSLREGFDSATQDSSYPSESQLEQSIGVVYYETHREVNTEDYNEEYCETRDDVDESIYEQGEGHGEARETARMFLENVIDTVHNEVERNQIDDVETAIRALVDAAVDAAVARASLSEEFSTEYAYDDVLSCVSAVASNKAHNQATYYVQNGTKDPLNVRQTLSKCSEQRISDVLLEESSGRFKTSDTNSVSNDNGEGTSTDEEESLAGIPLRASPRSFNLTVPCLHVPKIPLADIIYEEEEEEILLQVVEPYPEDRERSPSPVRVDLPVFLARENAQESYVRDSSHPVSTSASQDYKNLPGTQPLLPHSADEATQEETMIGTHNTTTQHRENTNIYNKDTFEGHSKEDVYRDFKDMKDMVHEIDPNPLKISQMSTNNEANVEKEIISTITLGVLHTCADASYASKTCVDLNITVNGLDQNQEIIRERRHSQIEIRSNFTREYDDSIRTDMESNCATFVPDELTDIQLPLREVNEKRSRTLISLKKEEFWGQNVGNTEFKSTSMHAPKLLTNEYDQHDESLGTCEDEDATQNKEKSKLLRNVTDILVESTSVSQCISSTVKQHISSYEDTDNHIMLKTLSDLTNSQAGEDEDTFKKETSNEFPRERDSNILYVEELLDNDAIKLNDGNKILCNRDIAKENKEDTSTRAVEFASQNVPNEIEKYPTCIESEHRQTYENKSSVNELMSFQNPNVNDTNPRGVQSFQVADHIYSSTQSEDTTCIQRNECDKEYNEFHCSEIDKLDFKYTTEPNIMTQLNPNNTFITIKSYSLCQPEGKTNFPIAIQNIEEIHASPGEESEFKETETHYYKEFISGQSSRLNNISNDAVRRDSNTVNVVFNRRDTSFHDTEHFDVLNPLSTLGIISSRFNTNDQYFLVKPESVKISVRPEELSHTQKEDLLKHIDTELGKVPPNHSLSPDISTFTASEGYAEEIAYDIKMSRSPQRQNTLSVEFGKKQREKIHFSTPEKKDMKTVTLRTTLTSPCFESQFKYAKTHSHTHMTYLKRTRSLNEVYPHTKEDPQLIDTLSLDAATKDLDIFVTPSRRFPSRSRTSHNEFGHSKCLLTATSGALASEEQTKTQLPFEAQGEGFLNTLHVSKHKELVKTKVQQEDREGRLNVSQSGDQFMTYTSSTVAIPPAEKDINETEIREKGGKGTTFEVSFMIPSGGSGEHVQEIPASSSVSSSNQKGNNDNLISIKSIRDVQHSTPSTTKTIFDQKTMSLHQRENLSPENNLNFPQFVYYNSTTRFSEVTEGIEIESQKNTGRHNYKETSKLQPLIDRIDSILQLVEKKNPISLATLKSLVLFTVRYYVRQRLKDSLRKWLIEFLREEIGNVDTNDDQSSQVSPNVITELLRRIRRPVVPVNDTFDQEECIELSKNECNSSVSSDNEMSEPAADDTDEECTSSQTTETILSKIVDQIIVQSNDFTYDRDRLKTIVYDFSKEFCYVYRKSSSKELYRITSEEPNFLNFLRETGHTNLADSLQRKNIEKLEKGLRKFLNKYLHEIQSESDDEKLLRERVHDVVSQIVDDHLAEQSNACDNEVSDKIIEFSCNKQYLQQFIRKTVNDEIKTGMTNREIHIKRLRVLLSLKKKHGLVSWLQTLNKSMSRKSISAKCVSVAIYEEGKHTSIQKLVDENEINGAGQHLIMTEKLGAELPSDLSSTYDNTIVAYKNLSDLNKTAEARFDSESLIFLKEYIDTHITDVANENRLKLYSRENKIHDSRKSLNLETDEECITQTCCSEDALNKVNDNDSNTVKNSTDCSIVGEYALPLSYDVATTSNTRNDNQQSQYSSASVSVVQPRRVTFSNQNCLFYGPPLTSGENNEVISRDDVEPVRENSEKLREEEADIMEKLYRVLAHDAKTLKDIGEAREESKIARNVWISDVMNERKYTTRRDDFQDIDVTEATEDSVEGNDEKVTHFNTSEEEVEGIGCTSRQFLHEEVDTGVFQQYHTEDEARQSHLLEFVRPGVHPGGEEVNEEATEMRDWLEEYIEATVVARMQNHRRTGDSILSECDHRNTYRRERGVVNSLTSDVQSYQDCCRRGGRNHGERNDAHSTTCVRGSDVALWSLDDVEESGSLEPHTTEVQNDLGTNDNMSDVAEKVVSESETSSRGAGEDPTGEDPTGEDPTGEELLLQRFLQDAASRVGEPEWRNELLRCLRQYVADAVERCVQRRSNTLAGSRTKQRLSRSLSQVCRLESTGQRFASDNNTAIKEQVKLELREWLCYYVEERLDERLGPILGTPSDITEGEAGSNIERYGSLPTVRLGHFDPNVRDSPGGSGTFPENISSQRSICTDETFTSPISQDIHINKSDVSVAILCGETNSIESYDSYEYCFDRHTDVKKKESKNILKTSLIDMALVEVQPHQLDRSQDILEDYHRCTTPLSMISRTLNSYRDMVKQNVEEQVDNISITKNISDEKIVENLNNQPIVSDELNETIERKNNEVNQVLPVMAMNDVQDVDNDNIIPYDFIAPMTPLGSPRSASIIGSVHRLVKQTSESSPLIPNLYESNAEYNSDSSKKGRYLIFQPFQIKEKLRDRKSSEELGIILHAPSNVSSETSTLSSVPSTGVGATISITSCPSAAQRVNTESKELLREITSQDVPSPYIFHKVSFNKCPIDSGSKESENNNGGTSHKNTRFNYNNQVSSHQNTSTIDTNIRKSLLSSTTHRSLQNNDLTIGNINRYSQNYYSTLGNTHSFGLKMNRRSSASSHIPKRVQYNRSEPTVESDTFPTLSLQYVHDKTYTYIPQGVSTEMKNSDDGSKPFFCVPQPFKKLYKSDTTAISSDRNVSKIDSTLSKTSNQVEEKLQQNTGYTPENILRNRKDSHLGIRLFIPKESPKSSSSPQVYVPQNISSDQIPSSVGNISENLFQNVGRYSNICSPKHIPTHKSLSLVEGTSLATNQKFYQSVDPRYAHKSYDSSSHKTITQVSGSPYIERDKTNGTLRSDNLYNIRTIPTATESSSQTQVSNSTKSINNIEQKESQVHSPKRYNSSKSNIPNSVHSEKPASEVGKGPYVHNEKPKETPKGADPFSPKSIPTYKAASEVGKGPYPSEKKTEKTSKTLEPFSPKSIPTYKAASEVGKGPYPAEKKMEKTSKTTEPFSPECIPTFKVASEVGKGPYPAEMKTEKAPKTPEPFSPKSIPTDKIASEVGKGPYPSDKKKENTSKTPEPFSPKSIPTDKAASEVGKGPYPAEKKKEKTSKTPEPFSPKSIPTEKAASGVGKGPYPAEKKKEKTSKTPEPFSPKSIPTDKAASGVGKGPYPAEKKKEKTSKTPEPFSPKSIPTDKAASEVGKGPYPAEKKTEKTSKTPETFSPKSIPTDKAASEVGKGPYPAEKKKEKTSKTPEPFSPKSIPTDKAASEVGKGPYPAEKKTEKTSKTPEPFSPKSIPTDKAASEVGKGPYPTEKKTEKKPKSPEPFSPKSIPTDKAASEVGKGPYPTEKKTEASKIPETLSPKSIPTDKTAFEVHNDPFLSVRKISKDRFPLESFLSKSMPMEKVASEVDTGHSHSEMVTKKLSKPFGSSKNIFTDEPVSEFNTVSFSSNKNTDRVAEDMSANVVAIDKTDFDFDEGFYPSQKKFNELSESFEPFNPRAITLDEFSSAVQKNLNNFITENTSISICSNKFDSSMGRKSYFAGRDLKHSYKSQHPIVNQCVSNLRNSSGVRNTTSLLGRNTESNASVNEPHQSSESNFPEGNDNATSKLSQYHAPNTISTNKYLVLSPKRQYQDGHINTSYCTPEQSDQEYNDELSLADNVSCSLSEDCSILLQSRRTVSSRMLGPYTSLENSIDKSEGTISFISTATSVQQDYSVSGEYQKTAEQKIDIKAQSECQSALNVNILSECGVSKLNDAISSITLQSSVPAPTISDIKSSISYQLERNAIIPFESNNTTKLPSYRNSHSDKSCYLTDELDKRQFCLPTLCDLIGDLHLSQDTESNSSNISSLTEYPAFNIHPWVVNSIVEGEKPISNEIAPGPFPNSDIYSTAFESSINSNTHALDHTLDVPDTSITIDKLSTPESDSESRIKTNATDIISLELRDNKRAQEVDGEVEDEDSSLSRESSKGNNKYIENSKSVVRSTGLNTDKCNDFVFDRNFTKHDTHKTNYFKISGFSTHQITSDIKIDTPISRTDINVQNDSLNNKIVLQQKQDVTHSFQQFSDFKRNLISSQPSTGAFTRSEGVKNSSLSDNQCADSLIGMSSSHINTSLVNKEVYFNGTDNSDSAKNFSNTIVERETIPNDINIPLNSEKRVNEIQSSSVVSSSVFANKDGYSSAKMNELHSEGEIYKCENDLEKFTPLRVRTEENDTLRGTLYNQQKIVENFISSERMDFTVDNDSYAGACATLGTNLVISIDKMRSEENFNGCSNKNTEIMTSNTPSYEDEKHKRLDTEPQEVINQADVITSIEVTLKPNATITNQELSSSQTFGSVNAQDNKCDTTCVATNSQEKHSQKVPYIDTYPSSTVELAPIQPSVAPCATGKESHDELHEIYSPKYQSREKNTLLPSNREIHDIPCSALRGTENYLKGNILSSQDKSRPEIEQNCKSDVFNKLSESESHLPDSNTNDECRNNSLQRIHSINMSENLGVMPRAPSLIGLMTPESSPLFNIEQSNDFGDSSTVSNISLTVERILSPAGNIPSSLSSILSLITRMPLPVSNVISNESNIPAIADAVATRRPCPTNPMQPVSVQNILQGSRLSGMPFHLQSQSLGLEESETRSSETSELAGFGNEHIQDPEESSSNDPITIDIHVSWIAAHPTFDTESNDESQGLSSDVCTLQRFSNFRTQGYDDNTHLYNLFDDKQVQVLDFNVDMDSNALMTSSILQWQESSSDSDTQVSRDQTDETLRAADGCLLVLPSTHSSDDMEDETVSTNLPISVTNASVDDLLPTRLRDNIVDVDEYASAFLPGMQGYWFDEHGRVAAQVHGSARPVPLHDIIDDTRKTVSDSSTPTSCSFTEAQCVAEYSCPADLLDIPAEHTITGDPFLDTNNFSNPTQQNPNTTSPPPLTTIVALAVSTQLDSPDTPSGSVPGNNNSQDNAPSTSVNTVDDEEHHLAQALRQEQHEATCTRLRAPVTAAASRAARVRPEIVPSQSASRTQKSDIPRKAWETEEFDVESKDESDSDEEDKESSDVVSVIHDPIYKHDKPQLPSAKAEPNKVSDENKVCNDVLEAEPIEEILNLTQNENTESGASRDNSSKTNNSEMNSESSKFYSIETPENVMDCDVQKLVSDVNNIDKETHSDENVLSQDKNVQILNNDVPIVGVSDNSQIHVTETQVRSVNDEQRLDKKFSVLENTIGVVAKEHSHSRNENVETEVIQSNSPTSSQYLGSQISPRESQSVYEREDSSTNNNKEVKKEIEKIIDVPQNLSEAPKLLRVTEDEIVSRIHVISEHEATFSCDTNPVIIADRTDIIAQSTNSTIAGTYNDPLGADVKKHDEDDALCVLEKEYNKLNVNISSHKLKLSSLEDSDVSSYVNTAIENDSVDENEHYPFAVIVNSILENITCNKPTSDKETIKLNEVELSSHHEIDNAVAYTSTSDGPPYETYSSNKDEIKAVGEIVSSIVASMKSSSVSSNKDMTHGLSNETDLYTVPDPTEFLLAQNKKSSGEDDTLYEGESNEMENIINDVGRIKGNEMEPKQGGRVNDNKTDRPATPTDVLTVPGPSGYCETTKNQMDDSPKGITPSLESTSEEEEEGRKEQKKEVQECVVADMQLQTDTKSSSDKHGMKEEKSEKIKSESVVEDIEHKEVSFSEETNFLSAITVSTAARVFHSLPYDDHKIPTVETSAPQIVTAATALSLHTNFSLSTEEMLASTKSCTDDVASHSTKHESSYLVQLDQRRSRCSEREDLIDAISIVSPESDSHEEDDKSKKKKKLGTRVRNFFVKTFRLKKKKQ